MCSHGHQELGDPEAMRRLSAVVEQLRRSHGESTLMHAELVGCSALTDGNPWARTLARGVLAAVVLVREGRESEADELIAGELTRALPANPADSLASLPGGKLEAT
jgi:hypothetical protein